LTAVYTVYTKPYMCSIPNCLYETFPAMIAGHLHRIYITLYMQYTKLLVWDFPCCDCRTYTQGWPEPYLYTVYDHMYGIYPAKNAVHTPYIYIYMYGSGQPYIYTVNTWPWPTKPTIVFLLTPPAPPSLRHLFCLP
jgi:hypothetical protein